MKGGKVGEGKEGMTGEVLVVRADSKQKHVEGSGCTYAGKQSFESVVHNEIAIGQETAQKRVLAAQRDCSREPKGVVKLGDVCHGKGESR